MWKFALLRWVPVQTRAAGQAPLHVLESSVRPHACVGPRLAGVAQLVEQLIRNQQVTCSSHVAGSTILRKFDSRASRRWCRHPSDTQVDTLGRFTEGNGPLVDWAISAPDLFGTQIHIENPIDEP
jgi:hypothetical protein